MRTLDKCSFSIAITHSTNNTKRLARWYGRFISFIYSKTMQPWRGDSDTIAVASGYHRLTFPLRTLPAVPVDEIGLKTGTDLRRIYLHSKNERTLVLSAVSKLFHGACSGPLELIAHQYCLVRVGHDDDDLSVHSTRSERSQTILSNFSPSLVSLGNFIILEVILKSLFGMWMHF